MYDLHGKLDNMLAKRWISSSALTNGNLILFTSKNCGALQFCVNYAPLNANTYTDCYPIPCIDELPDYLSGFSMFLSLDLQTGY